MTVPVSVTITPPTATLYDGAYVQFTATQHYDDGSTSTLTPFDSQWLSSDTSVANPTINMALWGRVYGLSPGTATLTVVVLGHPTDDPVYSATAPVTVEAAPPPPPPPATRFALAFNAGTNDPYVTWTPIDTHPNLVTSYSIDRGRSYELDQTDAGHATVTITDPDGILDPTNPTGPYYGQIRPLLHAILCRHDPVADTWHPRFRGYVEDYTYDVDPSQQVNRLTVSLVDLFDVVSAAEMQPGQFGTDVNGQVKYDGGVTPDQRIGTILMDAGLPPPMFVMLPGNVKLLGSTYSPGESALSACQEAADAEFPHVANLFCDRRGRLCFHGRTARFDPVGAAAAAGSAGWDYHAWKAGDHTAVAASPSDTAHVRALGYQRGLSKIINVATALEAGAPDASLSSRRLTNPASIATYGIRSWSASNLLTLLGDIDQTYPTSAATETKRFAQYYIDNYSQPKDRITAITFRSLHPTDPRAAANWDLLSRVDVGDTVQVTVAVPGGGGFVAEQYFVEGVHEDVRPLAPAYDDVTVTLDLSPRSYYTANPWSTPLSAPDSSIPAGTPPDQVILRSPGHSSGRPKPKSHGGDHRHGGADPVRINSLKAPGSTEAGEGGGGDGGGSSGIFYDTDPQTGDYLVIQTTSSHVHSGDPASALLAGINLLAGGTGGLNLSVINDNQMTLATAGNGGIVIEASANGWIGIDISGSSSNLFQLAGLPGPTTKPAGGNVVWRDASGFLRIG